MNRSTWPIAIVAALLSYAAVDVAGVRTTAEGYQSHPSDGNKTIGNGLSGKPLANRGNGHDSKESADEFAIRWLEAVDRGDYVDAYIKLNPVANASMSEGQFITAMKEARRRVGPTRGRTWVARRIVYPPQSRLRDRPEFGSYFHTEFRDGYASSEVSEVVGVGQKDDAKWSVVEYQCIACEK